LPSARITSMVDFPSMLDGPVKRKFSINLHVSEASVASHEVDLATPAVLPVARRESLDALMFPAQRRKLRPADFSALEELVAHAFTRVPLPHGVTKRDVLVVDAFAAAKEGDVKARLEKHRSRMTTLLAAPRFAVDRVFFVEQVCKFFLKKIVFFVLKIYFLVAGACKWSRRGISTRSASYARIACSLRCIVDGCFAASAVKFQRVRHGTLIHRGASNGFCWNSHHTTANCVDGNRTSGRACAGSGASSFAPCGICRGRRSQRAVGCCLAII
jgi:hypothetical protein